MADRHAKSIERNPERTPEAATTGGESPSHPTECGLRLRCMIPGARRSEKDDDA